MNLPPLYWQISVISQALIIPVMVWWVGYSLRATRKMTILIGLLLVIWYASVFVLACNNIFNASQAAHSLPWIGIPISLPVILMMLVLRWRSIDITHGAFISLVALQFMRISGGEFILAYYDGYLPAHFGLAAGWGDVITGVAAPLVAMLAYKRTRHWRRIAYAWNIFGILDLVNAVSLGSITSPGLLRLIFSEPHTGAVTVLPLSLIPTFGVPIAMIGHVLALHALRNFKDTGLRTGK